MFYRISTHIDYLVINLRHVIACDSARFPTKEVLKFQNFPGTLRRPFQTTVLKGNIKLKRYQSCWQTDWHTQRHRHKGRLKLAAHEPLTVRQSPRFHTKSILRPRISSHSSQHATSFSSCPVCRSSSSTSCWSRRQHHRWDVMVLSTWRQRDNLVLGDYTVTLRLNRSFFASNPSATLRSLVGSCFQDSQQASGLSVVRRTTKSAGGR